MTRPGLIDRHGLLNWADSIGARSELPRLIRRLILETGRGVVQLGFPAGEGVSAANWDGTVRATAAAPYVPLGLSLWELSVEKSAGAKADKDYTKRGTAPDGSSTNDCTYVAVSLRPWTKRAAWARDRAVEGRWKAVRALAVDDVDTWLEAAPITHAWLSELVGLHPHGLVTAQTWWNTWSSATNPAFPRAAVVAGRDAAVTALRSELSRPGRLVTIRGSSRDEVAAFVSSLALNEERSDAGTLLARTAFVDDVEAWRRLRDHQTSLVLVALADQVASEFAPGSPHVLIVPLIGSSDADIVLPPIDSLVAAEVLKGEGLQERQADDAGKLARLSLLAARRRLANKRELHRPAWAQAPAVKTVRRIVLIGRWHENSTADRALVENAVSVPYDALREEIAALAAGGDPFLARVGGAIGIVSHFDAWLLLRGELRKDDLEAFHQAVRMAFAEIDPRFELPEEDRWRASLLGRNRSYSHDLRQGLATTLALLGAYGDRPVDEVDITGREWAAWIVRETLEAANADITCHLWASLTDVLPLLAEAAPSNFLEAVRAGTRGDTPLLRGLFGDTTDGGNVLSTESAHSSLLWALETCAWSPAHFGLVIDLLARLAEIDPGGRLANRPFASLQAILLPWHPQNAVTPERRLAAIDGLRDRHREIAWKLLLTLLPEMHGVSMNISEPHFRDWKPEKTTVAMQEYWTFINEICMRVLYDVDHDLERWVVLIEKIDDLPPPARAAVLVRLGERSNDDGLSAAQRSAIWEALRAKAARHREFAGAGWALPSDEVAAIEATATQFEPTNPTENRGWLFKDQMPEIFGIKRGNNFEEYNAALTKVRAEAAAEIADSADWLGLRSFALSTPFPWIFGIALAQARRYEYEGELLQLLESADHQEINFAAGHFSQRFRDEGWSWIESYLNSAGLSPDQAARLLLCTEDYPKAWEIAEGLGETVATIFWQHFRAFGLGGDFAYVDLVAERLLDVRRPGGALDLIVLYLHNGDGATGSQAELIARGLATLLERAAEDPEMKLLSHYDLMKLFSALEHSELPQDRLAQLEWTYLPAFGIDGQPVALNQMLSQHANFFVDIIRHIYRPRDRDRAEEAVTEPDVVDEEQRAAIAANAYRLLSEWKTVPGRREDGSVDAEALGAWVHDARAKLRESGHLEVGDIHIGHVLAWGPATADGSRPCLEVRNLLEELQSSEVEDGLRIEIYNTRGPTSRGMFDGGDQERAIAASYFKQAEEFTDRWPRTAEFLRELSESYEREGRRMDEEAERRRKGFDN
jgi:hypothetical protein